MAVANPTRLNSRSSVASPHEFTLRDLNEIRTEDRHSYLPRKPVSLKESATTQIIPETSNHGDESENEDRDDEYWAWREKFSEHQQLVSPPTHGRVKVYRKSADAVTRLRTRITAYNALNKPVAHGGALGPRKATKMAPETRRVGFLRKPASLPKLQSTKLQASLSSSSEDEDEHEAWKESFQESQHVVFPGLAGRIQLHTHASDLVVRLRVRLAESVIKFKAGLGKSSPRPSTQEVVNEDDDDDVFLKEQHDEESEDSGRDSGRHTGASLERRPSSDSLSHINITDSEDFETDLEEDSGKPDTRPFLGVVAYNNSCAKHNTPSQKSVVKMLATDTMCLNHRNLGPVGLTPLTIALSKNTYVESLLLRENGLDADAARQLSQLIVENEFIHTLDLTDNKIGPLGAYWISESLRCNHGVETLMLEGNNIGNLGIQAAMVSALKVNSTLKRLDLSYNAISFAARELGPAIRMNKGLEELDISYNHMIGKMINPLIKGISSSTTLHTVNLSGNGIGYHGCIPLGNMLKKNTVLRSLGLSRCNINWDGVQLIADGVKTNETLQALDLGFNPMMTQGAQDLIEAVARKTCKLSQLKLTGIPVIGEFEIVAMAILEQRDLEYEHGGIVNSHDPIGLRVEQPEDPMKRLINFMEERGLRPHDLFRSLDKNVAQAVQRGEFIRRIKDSGLNLTKHESQALLANLEGGTPSSNNIDYKTLIQGVKKKRAKERQRASKQKEKAKLLDDYHKHILSDKEFHQLMKELEKGDQEYLALSSESGQPDSGSVELSAILSPGKGRFRTPPPGLDLNATFPLSKKQSSFLPPVGPLGRFDSRDIFARPGTPLTDSSRGLMSMAGNLGGNVKAFGTTSIEKKKKKSKKKKRKPRIGSGLVC